MTTPRKLGDVMHLQAIVDDVVRMRFDSARLLQVRRSLTLPSGISCCPAEPSASASSTCKRARQLVSCQNRLSSGKISGI